MEKRSKKVDRYIAAAPRRAQPKLREVRELIIQVAPESIEGFSYRMPFYSFKGRLAWFGLHTTHIGLYLRPPIVEDHMRDLRGYTTTKSAVHLPLDEKIPRELVRKLVRAAVEMNEATKHDRAR